MTEETDNELRRWQEPMPPMTAAMPLNHEGPTRYKVTQRGTRCGTCKYHECHSQLCTRSGSGGWRDYACSHPEAFKGEEVVGHPGLVHHVEAIERQAYGGRLIGRTEEAPDWCPFLRKQS